jgi:hypothetical protein
MTVEGATASLGGQLVGVYAWDSIAKAWVRYFPGAPGYANTLSVLEAGEAYFIMLSEPASWTY